MQRLKTKAQFEAVLGQGRTVSRTAHFVLHRLAFPPAPEPAPETGPGSKRSQALFAVCTEAWMGAIVPKRWARRAVTRNAIKRQIDVVSLDFEARLPAAVHVVRLRAGFDKALVPSATSVPLKRAVRAELQQLFAGAKP